MTGFSLDGVLVGCGDAGRANAYLIDAVLRTEIKRIKDATENAQQIYAIRLNIRVRIIVLLFQKLVKLEG